MIHLLNLQKTFITPTSRVRALDGVSLEVRRGEIHGIVGFSGSGKSTLLRAINLLERPDSGTVVIDGQEATALDRRTLALLRRKVGMIFQHFHLLDARTVEGNIGLPLELAGTSPEARKARVLELARLVGIEDKLGAYPGQLSGGQKQRVAIARALANAPEVLLCDEATSALDPESTVSILQLLKDIQARTRVTIVLVTHELEVVRALCHRVAVMEAGRIVEAGAVERVFTAPESRAAQRLMSIARDLRDGTLFSDGAGI
jgi:D-methionine transport system ATP-binding protein